MMDPAFARNRVVAWRDEELSIDEARRVRDAIEADAGLTTLVEVLAARTEALREALPAGAPRTLTAEIVARLEAAPPPRRLPSRRLAGVAATCLLLGGAAMSRVSDGRIESVPPAEPPTAARDEGGGVAEGGTPPSAPEPAPDPWNGRPPGTAPHLGQRAGRPAATARPTAPRATARTGDPREPIGAAWEGTEPDAAPTPSSHLTLHTAREAVLRDIASIAGDLGGALVDGRGKRLAPYPMESGETRTVRLSVPSYNVGLLQERLARLGEIVEGQPVPGPATPGGDVTLSLAVAQR